MKSTTGKRVAVGAITLALAVISIFIATGAFASDLPTITVDGVEYPALKVTPGGTVHYRTPDVNPSEAFTDRHVWTGNGSEHLPCEYGIHWIDNANLLTISNCTYEDEETTTTTTVEDTTTTTVPDSTTTTDPGTTTTTITDDTTTTTAESTTTTVADSTTTTVDETTTTSEDPVLPFTGANTGLLFVAAFGLLALGAGALKAARAR